MKTKVISGIVSAILLISGAGWTAARTVATRSDVDKAVVLTQVAVDKAVVLAQVAGGKADYLLTQQIESVRDKQKRLREEYRKASSNEKKSIELDLRYWESEQKRLEAVQGK